MLQRKSGHFSLPVSLVRCVHAGEPTDRLRCTDKFCILWSSAMGTWLQGTNGWNCWPFRPLGAQRIAPHLVELTRVWYVLPHVAQWNKQRLSKWDFIFDQFSKVKTPKDFVSCLRKKPAQIIDALKRALIGEWQKFSDTAMRAAIRISGEGWLALWWPAAAISCDYLGSCSLRLYRAFFYGSTRIISGDIASWFLTLFMKHPVYWHVFKLSASVTQHHWWV